MQRPFLSSLLALTLAPWALAHDHDTAPHTPPTPAPEKSCRCCEGKTAAPGAERPASHPLKGVVLDVLPERGGLLVKHEEIPGFMKAMTMLFRVDKAVLAEAKKGQAVTGVIFRRDTDWWLAEVKLAPAP